MPRAQRGSHSETGSREERPSALLVVRCWLEPQRDAEPVVRGYIRDLRSGEEVAIGDLKAVEQHVRRQLHLQEQQQEQELTA